MFVPDLFCFTALTYAFRLSFIFSLIRISLSAREEIFLVKDIVESITPVPGGVGPMTIACLLDNLMEIYIKNVQK